MRQRDAFNLFRLAESDILKSDTASQDAATRDAARILTTVGQTKDLKRQIQQELSTELALAGRLTDAIKVAKEGSSSEFLAKVETTLKLFICRLLNRAIPHHLLKSWFAPNIEYRSTETGITRWTMRDLVRFVDKKIHLRLRLLRSGNKLIEMSRREPWKRRRF